LNADANTGGGSGGGGGESGTGASSGNGGSGVVIIRLPQTATVTKGANHTMNTIVDGAFRIYAFTQGDDDITIS
jgi:hypothetical protein